MQVLIVEDEPAIADTVIYALETEGIRSHWVSTGTEAIAFIRQQSPELVLLDIGLPDMSGFDVCRRIREFSQLPIIFLTSRHNEIDQVLGLELGADDYVTKPFSPRVLTARVRAKLRRQTPALQSDSSSVAGFSDDPDAQRISLHGQPLDISRYEYRLLALFLKHPHRIYSREQLMVQVWEEPEKSFDRTVDTHIKTLRQKIRQRDAQLDPIKTHRGIGYSFEG